MDRDGSWWFKLFGNYGATSASYVFDTSALANGTWSFVVQVTDSAGATVNSTAVSVQVDPTPIPGLLIWSVKFDFVRANWS